MQESQCGMKQEQNELKVLNKIQSFLLMAINNKEDRLKFLNYLASCFAADQVFIALYDPDLDIKYSSEKIMPNHPQIFNTFDMTFLLDKKYLKHTGNIEFIQQMEDFTNVHHFIEAPLLEKDGSTIGIMGIVNGKIDCMNENFLAKVTNSVSMAIQSILYQEDLEIRSTYDTLTGVKNRNAYEKYLNDFVPKSLDTLGLIVVDINGLKACNDTSGHLAGDILIKNVAKTLSSVFGSEYVYRFGGDEFIILCENVTKDEMENKIQVFCQHLSNASVSLGYSYEKDNISIQNMQIKADEKMYQSKEKFYKEQKDLDVREN